MKRRDKINYYLDIAEAVGLRGTCLRRNYGAIIVKNDEIVSTGFNGAPRGRANCCDTGTCVREKLNIPTGQRYELCRSVHAEANCMLSAARSEMLGATIYLVGKNPQTSKLLEDSEPCSMCKRLLINSGIAKVIIRQTMNDFKTINVEKWIEDDESLEGSEGY